MGGGRDRRASPSTRSRARTRASLGAARSACATRLTVAPLLWLVGYARQRRIAYRGDWLRAIRRGAWIGVLVAVFVVMRLNGIFQPQIALFLVALALVAEVTLSDGERRAR